MAINLFSNLFQRAKMTDLNRSRRWDWISLCNLLTFSSMLFLLSKKPLALASWTRRVNSQVSFSLVKDCNFPAEIRAVYGARASIICLTPPTPLVLQVPRFTFERKTFSGSYFDFRALSFFRFSAKASSKFSSPWLTKFTYAPFSA